MSSAKRFSVLRDPVHGELWTPSEKPSSDSHCGCCIPTVENKRARSDANAWSHPQRQVWRHEVGAGWSSIAIIGNGATTQEQRGELEGLFFIAEGQAIVPSRLSLMHIQINAVRD